MLNFKDASDFKGRNVNENLVNLKNNMDKLAGAKDINVAYHLNAFNKTATGAEVWYWLGDPVGYAIAKKLSAAIANALGIIDRGPKATTNLYVIANTKGVTILPEICFIDNKSDMQKYQANKAKLFKAMLDVYASFPQYNFKSTHGGHHGLNMVDPGAVGNGYKEAVIAQEINQAILKQQNNASKPPVTTPNPPVAVKNTKPVTDGKVGDKVKIFDALYADSFGAGRSTAKKGSTGVIKKINTKGTKPYLVENWGWAHANDIQLVTSAHAQTDWSKQYYTTNPGKVKLLKADGLYGASDVDFKGGKVGGDYPVGTVFVITSIKKRSDGLPRLVTQSGYLLSANRSIVQQVTTTTTIAPKKKTNQEVAKEIYLGQGGWGNGTTRTTKLKAAGYEPVVIQNLVNKMY